MQRKTDVLIIGGGVVGLACACALAQKTSLSVVVLEQNTKKITWSLDEYDNRVSALALCTKNMLVNLGVWEGIISRRVSAFTAINVYGPGKAGELRFNAKEINETVLGYIVENNLLQLALYEKLQQLPQVSYLNGIELSDCIIAEKNITIFAGNNDSYVASLAIGADGANSWLRRQAKIEVKRHDYGQTAIVSRVKTALAHQSIAQQIFLNIGPLAFLPTADAHQSSIVWTLPQQVAEALSSASDVVFTKALQKEFGYLSEIISASPRLLFPLIKQTAQQYVADRIALLGDAAHVIHPLAGQGVNLGMLDMASLAAIIQESTLHNKDFAARSTLRRYERWRKADNFAMMAAIDVIKNIFSEQNQSLRSLRQFGLKFIANNSIIKNFFTHYAVGKRNGLPALARSSTW